MGQFGGEAPGGGLGQEPSRRFVEPEHLSKTRRYSKHEIVTDGVVHSVALAVALVGAVLLVWSTASWKSAIEVSAVAIYGVALVVMLTCSLVYNVLPASPLKWLFRRFDLSAIFLMIAGTYTPLLTQVSDPFTAWALAAFVWGGAITGIVAVLGFPRLGDRIKIILYLALGWVVVLALGPVSASLPSFSMNLVIAGGLLYTAGIVFFLWTNLRFQNVIWHLFVIAAAGCHFTAIASIMTA